MKVSEKEKKNLTVLKRWLDETPHGKLKLAAFLRYGTTATIERWFTRGRIAPRETERVMNYIKGVISL